MGLLRQKVLTTAAVNPHNKAKLIMTTNGVMKPTSNKIPKQISDQGSPRVNNHAILPLTNS
jgi:hypothetical protein